MPELAHFTEQHGITFTLLSDEGSKVITDLGLLNRHVEEQQAFLGRPVEPRYTGIPYPGLFVLDEDGIIVAKRFEQMYQPRPAPELILEDIIGIDALERAITAQAEGNGVRALAWLADTTYRPMQHFRLHVTIEIGPYLHIYGTPIPDGFTPLQIEVAAVEGLVVGPVELPDPRPFKIAGLSDEFQVHERTLSMLIPVQATSNLGELALAVDVRYQACTDSVCYPPESLRLALTLKGLDNLRPEPRG